MATLLDPSATISENSGVLRRIADPDCSLAVWRRAPFADFAPLVEGTPHDLRFTAEPEGLADRLAAELAAGGFGGGAALHRALAEDTAGLARLFCDALALARFELRLEVVRSDSCRKFHADYVTARLITTYVGEGTDWLDHADADRVAAGEEPFRINRLDAFDVGLFKGKLGAGRPAIHRSPPIVGTRGGARLLLVLNPDAAAIAGTSHSPLPPPRHLA
ncbi:DUF1826 domain-containing protein [Erythrobacter sp. WG]|uniref:DUF1826 domain-containing protein n=1 Tax=Erythrobacter sp. WG TaxID=2985510 RepID=UPI00226FFED3|nr:DUF1826 domain-containing protein [Erythrobacter sp. WG]MCX9148427.1 DUF1826 domain-containing protein [Erythrobacter sp. WG]